MRTRSQRSLTQQKLIAELKKRGHQDVTIRRLADWRRVDLLPPFDSIGAGRGRGPGRKSSSWANPHRIIDQAESVLKLLQMYRTYDEVYLALVMLGYSIPVYRVGRALSEPLNASVISLQAGVEAVAEIYGDCNIEDAIEEGAAHYSSQMKQNSLNLPVLSQDILEAVLNIFFNPTNNLKDAPFEDAVTALEDWNKEMLSTKLKRLSDLRKDPEVGNGNSSLDTVDNFLTHAPFFQRFLSLHQLKRAVDEATEDDLEAMLADVRLLREVTLIFDQMVSILSRELPSDLKTCKADVLPTLFSFGRLLMWADLSFRRNGFADRIDEALPKLVEKLRNEFDSKLEKECSAASPIFGRLMAAIAEDVKEMSNIRTNASPP